jgi:AraC family transcriptional regulator
MASQDRRSEYARRMHLVLEHIDRHLDEALELDTLAAVAHFSPFHFHRVFSAWMGETLGDYLRRRRLEIAALRLRSQPGVSVLSVALSVGFGSAEAFARAFKARFGRSPSSWRDEQSRDRNPGQAISNPNQDTTAGAWNDGASHRVVVEAAMQTTLTERTPATVAYLRHVGPYGQPISEFWQHVVYPWMVANNLLDRPRYGISHDDPGITAPEKCRYDAAVEVPPNFVGTGAYQMTTIPGGTYAVGHFKGTVAEIGGAWDSLLRDWLPSSGLQLDGRPFFEYYSPEASYDPKTGVFECDISVPVARV